MYSQCAGSKISHNFFPKWKKLWDTLLSWSTYISYCSLLSFQRKNYFQPASELKHSKYLDWCHKCTEIKGSPLHSNWFLLTHFTSGWVRKKCAAQSGLCNWKKNVIYLLPTFWKLKEKDKLQNIFFHFHLAFSPTVGTALLLGSFFTCL